MTQAAVSIQQDEANAEMETSSGPTEIVLTENTALDIDAKSDRDKLFEEITQRRHEQITGEIGDVEEVDHGTDPIEDPPEGAVTGEPESETLPAEEETVTVKIDGEERTIPKDEFDRQIREYQKHAAADKRLKEATDRANELAERERRLQEREKVLAKREAAPPAAIEVPKEDFKVLAQKLSTAMFQEDTDEMAAILTQIQGAGGQVASQTQADINAIVARQVQEELSNREMKSHQVTLRKAVSKFNTEYKDLAEDPVLQAAVDRQTIEEQRLDPEADPWTIIKRSAEHVKDRLVKASKPADKRDSVVDNKEDRVNKKRSAGPPVRSATTKSNLEPEDKEPKLSPVQEIMRARGQL